jgi:UDP-N-acetylglucosamine 2-epimerase (non-hydrolysing)
VQGDTTSAFFAGLSSYYLHIKVGHIEAGLRTEDKYRPFPEEINRHLLGPLADFHFAPTQAARDNLLKENVPARKTYITGNTVIDALLSIVEEDYQFRIPALKKIDFSKKVILVTAHRRENFGNPLKEVCQALKMLASRHPEIEIVFPVHPNPNVRGKVCKILGDTKRVTLVPPLDYKDFVQLLKNSYLVLTDSGGIQEEAPSLGKPVLVMREKTERPEAVQAGTAWLVGTKRNNIFKKTSELLTSKVKYQAMANAVNPYGDGKAAKRIVRILSRQL